MACYLDSVDEFLEEEYLRGPKKQLRYFLSKKSRNWKDIPISDSSASYYLWKRTEAEVLPQFDLLAEITERKLKYTDNVFLLLDLGFSRNFTRNFLPVIKDGYKNPTLPSFVRIDYESSLAGGLDWISAKKDGSFSLRDTNRFERTNYLWVKQSIYKEVSTGNYWYYDYYHKDNKIHYEVFDNTGKEHLGEANEKGELNPSKASDKKKIDKILGGS